MRTKLYITYLIVFLLSASICFGQKSREKSHLEKINLKQFETYRDKLVKKEVGTNFIKAKYNECYFNKRLSDPDSIALSYLRAKSPELGISAGLVNVKIKKTRQTPGGRYVYFEQHIDNIPVFSTTGLIALNKGDTVTYMLNSFRKISEKVLNTQPDITGKEAVKKATDYLHIENTIARSPKTELVFFESIETRN